MKPNYKNWMTKGLVAGCAAGTVIAGALFAAVLFTEFLTGTGRFAAEIILCILFVAMLLVTLYCLYWYNAFSYNGKKQISRRIIEKVSEYVVIPENGKGLDIGCGSGALTIACAKKNPKGEMVGLDRWGKEYASFNKPLCENNARIEGLGDRTSFMQGDACRLPFEDNSFDAATSNYCYHNIPSKDRQAILLETLRVLKKGGTFAIHDVFTAQRYGDMDAFLKKLRKMGYEKAELLDTMNGSFLTKKEAGFSLAGSMLLVGKK